MAVSHQLKLPRLELTELANEGDANARRITVEYGDETASYFVQPVVDAEGFLTRPNSFRPAHSQYPLFPAVTDNNGVIWPEATIYQLDLLELDYGPKMSTYSDRSADLSHFRRFLDAEGINWLHFPADKRLRPTYRYRAYLRTFALTGELSAEYLNRRIRAAVGLYRHAIDKWHMKLENPPWIDRDVTVFFSTTEGQQFSKVLRTTDQPITQNRADNPFEDFIQDGGKLVPLSREAQKALLKVVKRLKNIELSLICRLAMFAGPRIQTILTLRKGQFSLAPSKIRGPAVLLKCGPGTGTDTKNNKQALLAVPKWLYADIFTYLQSERYVHRARKNPNGDCDSQFVFLSHKGNCQYDTQEDIVGGRLRQDVKSAKTGQGIRGLIRARVIPEMRTLLGEPEFDFQFHDLRATFGINFLDFYQPLIDSGKRKRHQVMYRLSKFLWHKSPEITERYVEYRGRHNEAREANDEYFAYLQKLASEAMAA